MPRIFVTRAWPGAALDALTAAGHTVDVWSGFEAPGRDALVENLQDAAAVITTVEDVVDAGVLGAAGAGLRLVAQAGAGYDNVDLAAARAREVWVTNAPGVLDEATADFAFALLTAAARRVPEAVDYVRAKDEERYRTLIQRLGIRR